MVVNDQKNERYKIPYSQNIVAIMNELINDQELIKLLYYNEDNPYDKPDLSLPATNLIRNKIFPFPFNPRIQTEASCQLRVFYASGYFTNDETYSPSRLIFEIVVHKDLWLINDGTKSLIRPYEILNRLQIIFHKRSIGTLGRLRFRPWSFGFGNEHFDLIRFEAESETFKG